ncbi:NUDIX domain-containing protein [Vibrio sp. Isolate25]|uniref:bifunctional NUDIX hydrolase/phosphatase PAP2 family protein n=1 Tax=Vibrio sp. Isolate25 TaxID=2908535 RepID=UPI001EFD41D3|nr:bifunctional NUDIX hydrolase/phosphatase PAP2 family protein [Vibrio sp. Isolate25]MCG9597393.1 NUDIX domain-containing protein [Vibrio sp. Isolate25]
MIIFKQLERVFLFFALAFFSSLVLAEQKQPEIEGAACVIRADNKLVLVNEILTGKSWLPAGNVKHGEKPELAAQRETWEETGLVVSINKVLGQRNNTIYYDCISDSEIVAFHIDNSLDAHQLPIWFAPHYGVEIASAMLISPEMINAQEYRFPEQLKRIAGYFEQATPQTVRYVDNLVEAAPIINQIELGWLNEFHLLLDMLPTQAEEIIEELFKLSLQLNHPIILLMLFPYLYWRFGKEFSYKVFFAITSTSLIVLLAKQGFQLPPPQVYLASRALPQFAGYSLPSLPFAVWMCVVTLLLNKMRENRPDHLAVTSIALILWLAVASFYTGTHFIVDMFGGLLIGGLCAWHLIRLDNKPDVDLMALIQSKALWAVLIAAGVVMVSVWPIPVFSIWLGIMVTTLGIIYTSDASDKMITSEFIIPLTILMVAIYWLFEFSEVFVARSSVLSFGLDAIRYPVLMILFVVSVRKFAKAA